MAGRVIPLLTLLAANGANACPVCGTATEASKDAFVLSTAILSFVPLFLIGGVVLLLYSRARRMRRDGRGP